MVLLLIFVLLLEKPEHALTSALEVLAHASGLEIEFVDGICGKSATQMKCFSSSSWSITDVSHRLNSDVTEPKLLNALFRTSTLAYMTFPFCFSLPPSPGDIPLFL